jgi:hypothetical protein
MTSKKLDKNNNNEDECQDPPVAPCLQHIVVLYYRL